MNNLEDIQSRKEDLMADFIMSLLINNIDCRNCPAREMCLKGKTPLWKSVPVCLSKIKEWLLQESEEV